eukprot:2325179-Amphidinium_carterae.1
MFPRWLHLLSALSTASLTTAHSKLLDCNAKAKNATVLKPKVGKLATCFSVSCTYRNSVSVPKSKME